MRYAALLLDLDGTLVDSEPLHFAAHKRFLASVGMPVTQEDVVGNVGKGDGVFYRYLMAKNGITGDPDAWVERKTELLMAMYRTEGLALRPGVQGLLERAAARGIFAYVVTSAEQRLARLTLEVTGLFPRLSARVCYEDVAKHKPAPDPYLLAATRLSVPPEHCLVIEDSPSGVRAGKAAGCTVFGYPGVLPPEALSAAGADRLLDHLDQVDL